MARHRRRRTSKRPVASRIFGETVDVTTAFATNVDG
jgi:hypothetical protein